MELRWYWRVLQRQWRIIWIATIVVALLAGLYTAYSYAGSRYKGQTTIEFTQRPPVYNNANPPSDPVAAAQGNSTNATTGAKQFTQGNQYFQRISADLKTRHGRNIDWKVIRSELGANPSNGTFLELEYTSSNANLSNDVLDSATRMLVSDFLPRYNRTVLQTAQTNNTTIIEPPIVISIIDPPNAPSVSLSKVVIAWLEKALAGIVLGVALAFLWEYLDESIHDEQDVRNWMHTPTLGVVAGDVAQRRA